MDYYSDLKSKEILTHTTIWMNPEDIRQSEISQSQKDNVRFHLYEVSGVVKII